MKLFISYSHDSVEHKQWVANLASHLRSHGVDVILDQWDLHIGDDLPFFMESALDPEHKVLVICSAEYTEKANAGSGGVGYEKRILAADMMEGIRKEFVLPIIRNNHDKKVPSFLKGILYEDFDSKPYYDAYRELLFRIYEEDLKTKPELGNNPFDTKEITHQIDSNIAIEKIKFCNSNLESSVSFDYSQNNGLFVIGSGEYAFETMWTSAGMHRIHSYKDHIKLLGYKADCYEFPELEDIPGFDFSSRCRIISEGQVFVLENQNNHFAAIKVKRVFLNHVDSGHLVEFEYKIYCG